MRLLWVSFKWELWRFWRSPWPGVRSLCVLMWIWGAVYLLQGPPMTPFAIFALAVSVISACLRMGRELTDGSITPDWMAGMRGAQLHGGRLLANWLLALPLAVGVQLRTPERAGHWLDPLPGLSAFLLCGSAIVLFLLLSLGSRKESGGQENGSDLLRGAALTCLCLWVGVIIVKYLPAPAVFGCYMAAALFLTVRLARKAHGASFNCAAFTQNLVSIPNM